MIGAPGRAARPGVSGRRASRADRRAGPAGAAAGRQATCPSTPPTHPVPSTPAALVVLEQRVRPDARDTLDYFASQKVSIKVISGDNAVSVGAVAGSLGLRRRDDGRPRAARRARAPGRHPRGVHHLRPGAAGPEARDGACAAVTRAHRRDDRRRRQRRAGAQGRRHRCRDGVRQRGIPSRRPDCAAGQQVRDAAPRRRPRAAA